MKVRIQVVIEEDDGQVLDIHDDFSFERKHFQPERERCTAAKRRWSIIRLTTTYESNDPALHAGNTVGRKESIRSYTVPGLAPSTFPVPASIGVGADPTGRWCYVGNAGGQAKPVKH